MLPVPQHKRQGLRTPGYSHPKTQTMYTTNRGGFMRCALRTIRFAIQPWHFGHYKMQFFFQVVVMRCMLNANAEHPLLVILARVPAKQDTLVARVILMGVIMGRTMGKFRFLWLWQGCSLILYAEVFISNRKCLVQYLSESRLLK